jgi:hypothetical protein
MNLHEQRIAELHATYENGRVATGIYFVKSKSRFRVKLGGKWIGTYWSFKGAVKARNEKLIKELEEQIAVLKKEMED